MHASLRPFTASGCAVGVGVAAFIDETVFHQLLHWHHFWDGGSSDAALVSDGLFHAFGWFALVAGFFWYADLRRSGALPASGRAWWGGICLGLGGFQLYDGTVQHKLLRLHQIRYGVPLWPYDWTWNVAALIVLATGYLVLRTLPAASGGDSPAR